MRGSDGGEPEDGEGPARANWQDVENRLEAQHGQELADAVDPRVEAFVDRLAARLKVEDLRKLLGHLEGGGGELTAALEVHLSQPRDPLPRQDEEAEDLVARLAAVAGQGDLHRLYTLSAARPRAVLRELAVRLAQGRRPVATVAEQAQWLLDSYSEKAAAELGGIALAAIALLAGRPGLDEADASGESLRQAVARIEAALFALAPRLLRLGERG